jgi:hypothetical protein
VRSAALLVAGTATAALLAAGPASSQGTPTSITVRDAREDARTNLDITRFAFARANDGRLRATVTLAADWTAKELVAEEGPPGSICLRLWTVSDPPDTTPDFLVCVTADATGETLRGSVLRERPNQLPQKVADAAVSRPSGRSVALRFSQTSVGRPAAIDAIAETTRAGCPRVTCIDTAPDAPRTARIRVRKPASTNRPAATAPRP